MFIEMAFFTIFHLKTLLEPWAREDVPDCNDDLAPLEVVGKSRGGEEDGSADSEEGEPATSPGDGWEKQEKQEEHATQHH